MKKLKKIKKIAYICIIQIVIIIFFAWSYYCSAPVEIDEMKNATIIVEDVYYLSGSKISPKLFVRSNSCEYVFFNMDNYSARELYENIKIGDKIELTYAERFSLFGQYNMVCSAYGESQTYGSLDSYLKSHVASLRFTIFVFIFIESVFVFLVVASIILFGERKKKKKKGSISKGHAKFIHFSDINPTTSKENRRLRRKQ